MKEVKRFVFLILGITFLVLGLVGVVLPIIPGIPFFLVGLIFVARGSRKFLRLILKNKFTGKYIQMIRKEGISKKAKGITLATIWTTHLFSIIFIKVMAIKIFLVFTLLTVTWILIVLKGKEESRKKILIINKEM